jgi:hypothetical protein
MFIPFTGLSNKIEERKKENNGISNHDRYFTRRTEKRKEMSSRKKKMPM